MYLQMLIGQGIGKKQKYNMLEEMYSELYIIYRILTTIKKVDIPNSNIFINIIYLLDIHSLQNMNIPITWIDYILIDDNLIKKFADNNKNIGYPYLLEHISESYLECIEFVCSQKKWIKMDNVTKINHIEYIKPEFPNLYDPSITIPSAEILYYEFQKENFFHLRDRSQFDAAIRDKKINLVLL